MSIPILWKMESAKTIFPGRGGPPNRPRRLRAWPERSRMGQIAPTWVLANIVEVFSQKTQLNACTRPGRFVSLAKREKKRDSSRGGRAQNRTGSWRSAIPLLASKAWSQLLGATRDTRFAAPHILLRRRINSFDNIAPMCCSSNRFWKTAMPSAGSRISRWNFRAFASL